MSDPEYTTFKIYKNLEQAEEVAITLKKSGIDCALADNSPTVDITFANNPLQNEIQLLVRNDQLEEAAAALRASNDVSLEEVDPSHYLFEFSDKELLQILKKPENWGSFDQQLAPKILADRGVQVDVEAIEAERQERIQEMAKPEERQTMWIAVGYALAILGGIMGSAIGFYLWKTTKSLPNGQKVPAFHQKDRDQGFNIFVLSLVVIAIATIYEIYLNSMFYFKWL